MKEYRKALSVLLVAAMTLSTCGCSAKFEDGVIDQADKLGKLIQDRDYKKIEKMAEEGDKDLESVLALSTDTSELDNDAREVIASTLTYEVDEESFEGDFFGKEGSIDVTFTYVDYEKAIEDITIFEDLDAFEAAIEDCDDTVETTITFEFVNDGGTPVCSNIGDIADLFPYAKDEFNFALSRENYAGDIVFDNLNNGNGYIDADEISCHLNILGDGQELTWNYYYVVECYDVNLYTSAVTEATDSSRLDAEYSEYDILDDGNYVFTFYTDEDVLLGTASVMVTHTEVTPTPTPTPSGSGSGAVGPYYVSPADGIIALPDTNLVLALPTGHACIYADNPALASVFGSNPELMDNLVFFAVDLFNGAGAFAVRIPGASVDSPDAFSSLDSIADQYAPEDGTVTRTTQDFAVGDRVYTVQILEITESSGAVTYCNFVLIGDDDACYLLYFYSEGTNNIDTFMGGLTAS